MTQSKFLLFGRDKRSIAPVGSALISEGYLFVGHVPDASLILRTVRMVQPDLLVAEIPERFSEIRQTLEVIDSEMLCALVLLVPQAKAEEARTFLHNTRIAAWMPSNPVSDDAIVPIVTQSLRSFRQAHDHESHIRRLSENLESRKIIEQAKWLLVQNLHMSEGAAYDAIKKRSRDNRVPMRQVAESILLVMKDMTDCTAGEEEGCDPLDDPLFWSRIGQEDRT